MTELDNEIVARTSSTDRQQGRRKASGRRGRDSQANHANSGPVDPVPSGTGTGTNFGTGTGTTSYRRYQYRGTSTGAEQDRTSLTGHLVAPARPRRRRTLVSSLTQMTAPAGCR